MLSWPRNSEDKLSVTLEAGKTQPWLPKTYWSGRPTLSITWATYSSRADSLALLWMSSTATTLSSTMLPMLPLTSYPSSPKKIANASSAWQSSSRPEWTTISYRNSDITWREKHGGHRLYNGWQPCLIIWKSSAYHMVQTYLRCTTTNRCQQSGKIELSQS